jgi:hypothetical protein
MRLVPPVVARLLHRRAVVAEPVGFDDQAQFRPVEVDAVPVHSLLRHWHWQARPADEREKAPLELRVGGAEGVAVEGSAKLGEAGSARKGLQGGPKRFWIDQVRLSAALIAASSRSVETIAARSTRVAAGVVTGIARRRVNSDELRLSRR